MIILAVVCDANSGTIGAAGSGFGFVYQDKPIQTGTPTQTATASVMWKAAGGSEGSTYTIDTSVSERIVAICFAVNGADTSAIHAIGTEVNGDSATATVPAVTTSVGSCLRISIVGTDNLHTFAMGTAVDHTFIDSIWGGSSGAISAHYKTIATASTDPSKTVALNISEQWVGFSFAIAPSIAGTTYTQGSGGTLTSSGTLVRRASKFFAGTITTAGAIVKAITKFFAGTLTSSGLPIFGRTAFLTMAGTLTSSGALVRRAGKALAGTLTTAGALVASYIARGIPGTPWTLPTRSRVMTLMNRATLTVKERIRTLTLRDE